ncbi:MAG: sigma-70 family RNA polymerase sigma factor [Planctomycetes bacterium]|nr:sigma-70 family RNA polymerase sigma factor [Planctomycetota bacterium]
MHSPQNRTAAPAIGDAEILRLLVEQDGRGLLLLLTRFAAPTRHALKKRFGDMLLDTDIDDVLSDAALRAWHKARGFDARRGSLRAWFFVIASNTSREVLRKRGRRAPEVLGYDLDKVASRTELIPLPGPAFLDALYECIAALPELQRRIIEADLRTGEVARTTDLAAELQTSTNTVYVSRLQARRALRAALRERGIEPPMKPTGKEPTEEG